MKLSEIIKNYRSEHHLSQQEFAERCDVTKPYISQKRHINAFRCISMCSIVAIMRFLFPTIFSLYSFAFSFFAEFLPFSNFLTQNWQLLLSITTIHISSTNQHNRFTLFKNVTVFFFTFCNNQNVTLFTIFDIFF